MLRILQVDLQRFDVRMRIPFRYGITTLTACPHLFVKVIAEIDDKTAAGIAADHLPPKWFTKDPTTSFDDDVQQMLAVIDSARRLAIEAGSTDSVYTLVSRIHLAQSAWASERRLPPLLSNFGTSLIERGLIDAFCRARQVRFSDAVRQNLLGVRFGGSSDSLLSRYVELAGTEPAQWLPPEPIRRIFARHTVGMLDPLTESQIAAEDRVDDGLPQSLEAAIREYGLSRLKIKVPAKTEAAIERLSKVFEVATKTAQPNWRFTLDFNENFNRIEAFRGMWETITSVPRIRETLGRLDFVEQPIHRDAALTAQVSRALHAWDDRPPIIIDESDGYPGAAIDALACGYVGTSHKNCKGILKGLANVCLIAKRRQENPQARLLLSGEDLCNIGPIAVNQDLAFNAAVGIDNVERNGHHFVRGLSAFAPDIQQATLEAHGDLYRRHERGFVTLAIRNGVLEVGSIVDAPFGVEARARKDRP